MQKAGAQHNHAQYQPAVRQGKGAVLESTQGKRIVQLEAMAESSPQAGKLAQLAAMVDDSPVMAAQRKFVGQIHDSPAMSAQCKAVDAVHTAQRAEASAKPNHTGLPDNLKSGIKSLSGISLDHVKVHYNSPQPAQLNALAYAQGSDIHVAPGQEQHLPHEAWHVVQQAQGRVKPTMQMKEGVAVNDDQALEHEADVMGARAIAQGRHAEIPYGLTPSLLGMNGTGYASMQLKWIAGARPGLLMWDKLLDDAQWYYILPGNQHAQDESDGMFYARGNEISPVRSRDEWLESGATEIEDCDGEVVDVHSAPQERGLGIKPPSWSVVIKETPPEELTEGAKDLNKEWKPYTNESRSEPGDYECSGENWTQNDEGVDVSTELSEHPEYVETSAIGGGISIPYIAFYAGDKDEKPIALMELETRRELPNEMTPAKPHLYIRWLLGSPTSKGGGSALVQYAKIVTHLRKEVTALSVESAASAVNWYMGQGYTQVASATHNDRDTPCRCIYLAWPPEAAQNMREEHQHLLKENTKKEGEKESID